MKKLIELKIDPEFESIIPPLTDDEFKQLRENILNDGEVLNPIITWQGIICDGHNRWKIIRENPGIPYKTYELIFNNRGEAKEWIIDNQLGRRNLNPADAIILAQKKAEIIAIKAKEKQKQGGGDKRSEEYKENAFIKNDKTEKPVNTQKEIAKIAGVSTGTVAQFEQVQKKKPELIEPIRNGEMTIGGAYKIVKQSEAQEEVVQKQPEYTVDNLVQEISASGDNYIRFLKDTLVKRSTMYAEKSDRNRVHDAVCSIKNRIEEIVNLLN